jgi:hypothetical protein
MQGRVLESKIMLMHDTGYRKKVAGYLLHVAG